MSDDRFWALIDRTVAFESQPARQLEALRAALNELPTNDIEAFEVAFKRQMDRAYTYDLWGAAYVVHGGTSDDGFVYFRQWLISKGRHFFERSLANPDDLADLLAANVRGLLEFEAFAYVARDVWSQRTGSSIVEFYSTLGALPPRAAPRGTPFEEDASFLSARYPKLWDRFGTHPLP